MIYEKIYKESKLYARFMNILGFERGIGKFIDSLDISCPDKGKILDAGCGSGIIGLQLLERFPNSKLLATDIENNFLSETISNSQKRNIDASRISAGISDINTPKTAKLLNGSTIFLEKNSFDIVSVGAALGYSKNREETIKELLSFIKPGGYLIDIDMNDGIVSKIVASNYHYQMMSLDKIKKIIKNEGFEVSIIEFSMNNFPANLTRIGIVGKKN
jgi:ubiquinone/menaquinone biosynthesis C-methylase UbiE